MADDNLSRTLGYAGNPAYYPEYVDRWAIIVGISKYQAEHISLKYAHRDAETLYELIQTPSGGGFEKHHIVKLIDEEATTTKITRALRSFLKKPAKEDIVLIYFACHGAPDPDRPDIVYLLTYDTDPHDIAGTALPMREIDLSLKENLLADRVVIIADTCHSAAIGGGVARRSVNSSAEVNRYLDQLSETKAGLALLTSAAANETSQEGEQWGDGHGVFTYHLLEGMRGKADRDNNGTVTVGELFEYVRENVQKATANTQHPTIGTNSFDRNLPMAITGGISAHEHFRLGRNLYELGRLLDDKGRFTAAARQLQQAIRLAHLLNEDFPEAQLYLGLVHMTLGDDDKAVNLLQKAASYSETQAVANYHLGIAEASQRNYPEAITAFESFLQQNPTDENAAWVSDYVTSLKTNQMIYKRHALLIGIDEYSSPQIQNFKGCINDVELLKDVLMQGYKFEANNIVTLTNAQATRQGILAAFTELENKIHGNDVVVISFSGYAIPTAAGYGVFVPHDYNSEQMNESGISGDLMGTLITELACSQVVLILDTVPIFPELISMSKQNLFQLWIAGRIGDSPQEYDVKILSDTGHDNLFWSTSKTYGMFTYHLARQLLQVTSKDLTLKEIAKSIVEQIHKSSPHQTPQTPQFFGRSNQPLFEGSAPYLSLSTFSQRKNYASTSLNNVRVIRHKAQELSLQFPQLYYSLSRAFLEKEAYSEAIEVLEIAVNQQQVDFPEAILALGEAHICNGEPLKASTYFQQYLELEQQNGQSSEIQKIFEFIEGILNPVILLVGIDEYADSEIPNLKGAVNDVMALKKVLLEKCGFIEADIKILLNRDATRDNILKAFMNLTRQSVKEFTLFYFAGHGSETAEVLPTIISADGRKPGVYDISLEDLAALANDEETKLVAIIDAGWSTYVAEDKETRLVTLYGTDSSAKNLWAGCRTIEADTRPQPHFRALLPPRVEVRDLEEEDLHIGHTSIFNESIKERSTDWIEGGEDQSSVRGYMTSLIVNTLNSIDIDQLTFEKLSRSWETVIVSIDKSQQVFRYARRTQEFKNNIKKFLFRSANSSLTNGTIQILKHLIEQRNDIYPEGYLNLGVVYLAQYDYEQGISALEKAITQQSDNSEARYHLGKALFESGTDLNRAVSELRLATQQNPDNAAAFYYLGQAIRTLVEQETMVEVENAFRTYLERGAPVGQREEVRTFLADRNSQRSTLSR